MSILKRNQLDIRRWTLTGASDAQGADGIGYAVAQAYSRMVASGWTRADGDPFTPVHDYVYPEPQRGDAFRQTWGYDAAARTERAAAGAVCYSVRIPASADHALPSVAASVVGDRYVDSICTGAAGETPTGVILCAIASASATPPAWADILAATASSGALCTPADLDKAPNNRAGVTASATLSPASVSGAEWIHIVLRMGDYAEHRGAWVEGGAMLDLDSLALTWSGEVAPDGGTSVVLHPLYPYDFGDDQAAKRSHGDLCIARARDKDPAILGSSDQQSASAALVGCFDASIDGVGDVSYFEPSVNNLAGIYAWKRVSTAWSVATFADFDGLKATGSISIREANTYAQSGKTVQAISFASALDTGSLTLCVGVWLVKPSPAVFVAQDAGSNADSYLASRTVDAWPNLATMRGLCLATATSVTLDFYKGADTTTPLQLAFTRVAATAMSSAFAAGERIAFERPLVLGEHTMIAVSIMPVDVSNIGTGASAVTPATDLGNFTLHF